MDKQHQVQMVQRQKIYLTFTFFTKASISKWPQNISAASLIFSCPVSNAALGLITLVCFAPYKGCGILKTGTQVSSLFDFSRRWHKTSHQTSHVHIRQTTGQFINSTGAEREANDSNLFSHSTFPSTDKETLHAVSYCAWEYSSHIWMCPIAIFSFSINLLFLSYKTNI